MSLELRQEGRDQLSLSSRHAREPPSLARMLSHEVQKNKNEEKASFLHSGSFIVPRRDEQQPHSHLHHSAQLPIPR